MVFENWSYELLPTNKTPALSHNLTSNRRRFLNTTSLAIVACIGLIVALSYICFRPSGQSPLDNYQNLNNIPLLHANYTPSSPSSPDKRAVVSSLYSDSFAIAVAVVGHSTHRANVRARRILLYIENRVSQRALCVARAVGWTTEAVPFIPPPHNGRGIHFRFKDQYTKLNIWGFDRLGVESLVYIDADTLVRRNFDELFDIPFNFGAVPDVHRSNQKGFSIAFNAGVLALRPSTTILEDMKQKIETAKYPLEEAEQEFLNVYFGANSVRLPYAYNANLAIKDRSREMWEGLKEEARIVHYTLNKPFMDDSRPPEVMLTLDELAEVMRQAPGRNNGFYSEEIGWWREGYEHMMEENGEEITNCLRS